jgi:diguanylate cyclase (GGDEF)-like protein
VLFVDLDHFKDINDSLGHEAGDRLLRLAGERLERCLREGDSVARQGGDEFVISLPALGSDNDALAVAGKVLDTLRAPFLVNGNELHVSASIGISLYPADGDTADALMRAADAAMYHAKDRGRDNYQFFLPALNAAAQHRLAIANRLYQALPRNEFVLHYQPQLDLESGRILSAEALVRWQPPDSGLILPGEFIKVAEETGLIVPLGEWVLREACAQLKRWRRAGHPELSVAVNLSPRQLRRPGFHELAARVLREEGVIPAALQLEITEGLLMLESPENLAALEQLAAMGVRLAVDDFGTRYSSLAYLQRFPIHVLKIDRSFVSGIGEDTNDTAIVTAIIAMAESLRLDVIAEGVESAEQAAFLKSRGCRVAQGFYYSKAVSADSFTELLAG